MNGTPNLRSSFPSTPLSGNRGTGGAAAGTNFGSPKLPDITKLAPSLPGKQDNEGPLISFETIDAPAQRAYAVAIYTALWAWRLYDYYALTLGEAESFWLFIKWVAIDGVFLYALPGFRIPWLDWSVVTMTVLFCVHALLDFVLMFRVHIPWAAPLLAVLKIVYDSGELAISEHNVRPAKIINNPSLILGRQIINILPEGSAVLNPDNIPLCLDFARSSSTLHIPLQINHTNPVSIELIRFDLQSQSNETIKISVAQTKKMTKEAERAHNWHPSDPLLLQYPVKKTGLYKLVKVTDETNFEVSKRSSEALVVSCPAAQVQTNGPDRCRGDLSDLSLVVTGTPPLRVKYHRSRTDGGRDVSYQNIQPDDFVSPLMRQDSSALVLAHTPDMSWAAPHRVSVSLNETLDMSGLWTYSIEEVTDALNNVVNYMVVEDGEKPRSKVPHSEGSFVVHDLPRISFDRVDVQHPLRVAKGRSVQLPLKYGSTSKSAITDSEHRLQYLFTPADALTATGEHGANAQLRQFTVSNINKRPEIKEAGLYSLHSVSTAFCGGEVEEPASCMLINPPEPDITVTSEAIADKCAGRPVGLRLDLDLVGTPPFFISYSARKEGDKDKHFQSARFDGSRGQIELRPEVAGHYTYTLTELKDRIYDSVPLQEKNLVFEQDVKPSVSAHFTIQDPQNRQVRACIDEPVSFDVFLQGEGPWALEYELVHGGRRHKKRVNDIDRDLYKITTDKLSNGGEYTLALVSVTDRLGCKETLQQEAKIFVRHQRPKASFGSIEGKRTVRTLAGKRVELPVRLSGESPWSISYKDPAGKTHNKNMHKANDQIEIRDPGQYSIISVSDAVCPGSVDESANTFDIDWISRPKLGITESPLMKKRDNVNVRNDVCEGDEDALDITFDGRPPFFVKYEEHITPEQGQKSLRNRDMSIPHHSAQVKMDTSKAGDYEYRFSELGDENYDPDKQQPQSLTIRQRVNPRPSAVFANPGKVYSFCQGQEGGSTEEVIPIKLQGHAPFSVDIELRGIGKASRAAPITFSNIMTTSHELRIPHNHLQPGNSALFIRRVRDSRGCERVLDPTPSTPRVQISVHDPPSIVPVEQRTHYCVGERISFTLSGLAPFSVFYNFEGAELKAHVKEPVFRRIAEHPGNFTITGIQDDASKCRGSASITNVIHAMPSVKVSNGRESRVDIHAGGEAEILFEFGGVPPFEFTYTRSENAKKGDKRGQGAVLETKTLMSNEKELRIKAGEEGTYEVVAIRDRYCSFARPGSEGLRASGGRLLKERGEV